MDRRTLLSLIPAALFAALGAKVLGPSKSKPYLGYNEPYDRSLVKFTQEAGGLTRATLYWERVPGESTRCEIGYMQTQYFDLEMVHRAFERVVRMGRRPLPRPLRV